MRPTSVRAVCRNVRLFTRFLSEMIKSGLIHYRVNVTYLFTKYTKISWFLKGMAILMGPSSTCRTGRPPGSSGVKRSENQNIFCEKFYF